MGRHGLAVLAVLTPVPFTWASAAQQHVVLAGVARLLCAIELPMQILLRAVPLALGPALEELAHASTVLPHPALGAAAAEHHDYLTELHTEEDLLARQVILVLRDPTPHPHNRHTGTDPRHAGQRLLRALDDAYAALAPAGITLTALSASHADTVLATSTHPHHPDSDPDEADPIYADPMYADPSPVTPTDYRAGGGHHAPAVSDREPPSQLWWHAPDQPVRDWVDPDDPTNDDPTDPTQERVAGWLPERIQVGPRQLLTQGPAGTEYCTSLAIVGYPRQVSPGWLTPLLCYPGRLDVGLHIEPMPTEIAARRLRQQLARLESSRALDADKGRLADPRTDTAAADAEELATRLARGETRLHRLGLYLTLHAPTPDQLADHARAVRALASSMLLDARPTTYRTLQGWTTTLPVGIDALGRTRVMDTDALSCMIPLPSLESPGADPITAAPPPGVLYGHNLATGGLVIHDRFAAPNHNAVILAASGAGKSYLAKLELLRSLYRGVEVIVIDPEDEYARLATHVGGTHLRLGAPGVRINPLDLPHSAQPLPTQPPPTQPPPTQPPPTHSAPPSVTADTAAEHTPPPIGGDGLTRRALYLHTVLGVLLGELTAHERVLADQAIHTTYTRAGITYDPATWTRPAPLLADLATSFRDLADPAATDLAHRLTPYVSGSFRALFDGPTTTAPVGHLVVFSLKDLPDPLRGIGTLLALDATWRTLANPAQRRPRLVLVDEAWLLLQHPRRRWVPAAAGQSGPQTLGRAHPDHPRRHRPTQQRPRPRGRLQRRHPRPAAHRPPSRHPDRGRIRPHRTRTRVSHLRYHRHRTPDHSERTSPPIRHPSLRS